MFKKKEKEVTPEVEQMSKGEWMQKYWRPCAAFMYMTCCLADFAIFPIMFTVVQFWEEQAANDAFRQWVPITLQGGGLFHVAMGAVLGVSAYGRTQEKVAGAAGAPALPAGLPTQQINPSPQPMVHAAQGNVPMTPPGFYGQPVPVQQPQYYEQPQSVVVGFNGKFAPPPAPQPLL